MRSESRTARRVRNRLVVAATAAALVFAVTGCEETTSAGGAGAPAEVATADPTAAAGDPSASGETSAAGSDSPASGEPTAADTPTEDSAGTPAGAASGTPTRFLKLTEGYPMPNDVLISVTDVMAADRSGGVAAPAGSQRKYVAVQITNEGTRPLKVDGRVQVTVKRHDNGKAMKQVDWFPEEDSEGAGFFVLDVEPGAQEDARGFAFEDSGFDAGYEIYVTLDQPGSPAYPAKFLYAPPPAS
ncbi:hypothetical protein [Streptomyces sp. NPDC059743]|uniref:hypothetical protein n=1 Tax=Streptomyces sp. NPDC059743 TaxID=3346928 RepID=UPI003658A1CF